MRFAVFFHVFMLSMKVNSIVILNFHWDLLCIVYSWHVGARKRFLLGSQRAQTSAAAIFSGDLYIFATYAPVFSNRAFPTTFASHRHCHVRTYVQMRSFNFYSFSGQDVNVITPPHPCVTWQIFNVAWRMCARASERAVAQHHGSAQVRERYYPAPPHPTQPLRDVTHLQRSMTYVRTCKWTCRGVTSWECASTWTLLPHPTSPQGTYKKMPKTLRRFSTRRLKHLRKWLGTPMSVLRVSLVSKKTWDVDILWVRIGCTTKIAWFWPHKRSTNWDCLVWEIKPTYIDVANVPKYLRSGPLVFYFAPRFQCLPASVLGIVDGLDHHLSSGCQEVWTIMVHPMGLSKHRGPGNS